ncbi:MAG: NCS2 family permease, partial [bacterium]
LAYLVGEAELPERAVSLPPSLGPIFAQCDPIGALTWGFLAVVLTVFVIDLVDTAGTLLGLALKADMLDERGNLPEIEKPMLCDALATVVAAVCGTTTAGVYLESATGIQAGARSGLAAVVTGLLFLLTLFFAPLFQTIPACAYGPAVIIVGMLMLTPITKARLSDLTETIPIFTIVALMSFTSNLGIGLTAGFVVYPLMKVLAGKAREIQPGLWVLGGLSLLFFVFYPY